MEYLFVLLFTVRFCNIQCALLTRQQAFKSNNGMTNFLKEGYRQVYVGNHGFNG
jgi:hypothetical protein